MSGSMPGSPGFPATRLAQEEVSPISIQNWLPSLMGRLRADRKHLTRYLSFHSAKPRPEPGCRLPNVIFDLPVTRQWRHYAWRELHYHSASSCRPARRHLRPRRPALQLLPVSQTDLPLLMTLLTFCIRHDIIQTVEAATARQITQISFYKAQICV